MQLTLAILALLTSVASAIGVIVHCLRDKRSWVPRVDYERLIDHAQQLEMRVAVLERK